MGVKVTVVGGGSTYTPELVEGFVTRGDRLPVDELVLLDIDPERLSIVGALAERMLRRVGWAGNLTLTGDRDEALEGADFVIVQLRVGGQAARFQDETIPLRFGMHRPGDHRRRRVRQGVAHGPDGAGARGGDRSSWQPRERGSWISRIRRGW